MIKASRTKRRIKPSLDWTRIFCVLVLALAPFASVFWYFIPVAVSLFWQFEDKGARWLPLLTFVATITSPLWTFRTYSDFDLLGITFLFTFGAVHYLSRKFKQSFLQQLLWICPKVFLGAIALIGVHFWREGSLANYATWAHDQIHSEIFPYFFQLDLYKETTGVSLEPILGPIFQMGLAAIFAAVMTMGFLINGLMENLLKSFRMGNLRGQSRAFDKFNAWKAPEWLLAPLAVGLAFIVVGNWKPALGLWSLTLGWNLVILSLLFVFIQGMAVVSFLLTRLSFLFLLLLLGFLALIPIPILVLAGLADLWFDLRSKIDKIETKDV